MFEFLLTKAATPVSSATFTPKGPSRCWNFSDTSPTSPWL